MRAKRFTDTLPSENQLAVMFGVSRMTARKALVEFENEGLVERIRGKGTYMIKPDPAMGYFVVQPSRRHAETLEVAYTTRVLELLSLVKPPPMVARRMAYSGITILARRFHCFDGKPVRYEIRHLRGDLCGSLLFEDLERTSIHELLVDRLDLPLSKVWQRITAETLDADTAAFLEVQAGHPAFEDTFAPGRTAPPPGTGFGH